MKKTGIRFRFMVMVMAAAGTVFAQEAPNALTLTVDQAVDYALKNSYQIKSGAVDLGMAKRQAQNAAVSTLLPSVSASGTLSMSNEMSKSLESQIKATGGSVGIGDQMNLVVPGISVEWMFRVDMIDQIQLAHLSYEAGQITWEQTLRETELNVRKGFYGLLVQQEQLDVEQVALRNARDRMTQAQTNFRNGRIPELSYLQAQVAYENKRPSVLQMEQTLAKNLDTFAFLLGMTGGTKITLDGAITPTFLDLNADTLIDEHLEKRFDYLTLEQNIALLKKEITLRNHSAYLPVLRATWGYQPITSLSNNDLTKSMVEADNGSLQLTLAWNLTNLLPWSSTQQSTADKKDQLKQLNIKRTQLLESAKTDIRSKVNTLTLSRSNIAAMEANVNMARNAYNMTATAYQNGATELLDVRDAEKSLTDAQLGLAVERMNYITGVLDLEYALNTRFE